VDEDGNKILYIEELQSDWHQIGRDRGYFKEMTAEEKEIEEQLREDRRYIEAEMDRKREEIVHKAKIETAKEWEEVLAKQDSEAKPFRDRKKKALEASTKAQMALDALVEEHDTAYRRYKIKHIVQSKITYKERHEFVLKKYPGLSDTATWAAYDMAYKNSIGEFKESKRGKYFQSAELSKYKDQILQDAELIEIGRLSREESDAMKRDSDKLQDLRTKAEAAEEVKTEAMEELAQANEKLIKHEIGYYKDQDHWLRYEEKIDYSPVKPLEEKAKKINDELQTMSRDPGAVPDAPYKNTEAWVTLALKRITDMAIQGGYDSVAWTPGQVQSDRHRLGTYAREILYTEDGKLMVVDREGNLALNRKVGEGELPSYIGETVTERLLSKEPNDAGSRALVGGQLELKSQGMLDFYNKIMVAAAKNYVKKLDKKRGKVQLMDVNTKRFREPQKQFSKENKALIEGYLEEIQKLRKLRNQRSKEIIMDRSRFQREDPEFVSLKDERNKLRRQAYDLEDTIPDGEEALDKHKETSKEIDALYKRADELDDRMRVIRDGLPNLNWDKDLKNWLSEIERLEAKIDEIKPERMITHEQVRSAGFNITPMMKEKIAKGQPLFQKDDGTVERGYTDISDPTRIDMGFLQDANESTGIHELGHVFLEQLRDAEKYLKSLGVLDRKQQGLMNDIQGLVEELGVASMDDIKTEHHELFANNFMAYVMEGKSPSEKLRKVFKTFQTFLLNLYKSILGLERTSGVKTNLSDEMRAIFDRMLATEDEIQAVEEDLGYSDEEIDSKFSAIMKNTKSNKELDKVQAAHQEARDEAVLILYRQLLEQYRKQDSKEYKKRRAEVTAQFTKIADESPLYGATTAIKTGEAYGVPITGYETLKLDSHAIELILGEEEAKAFPRSLMVKDGLHPDILAQLFGFNDGKELVEAIHNNPNREHYIKTATDMTLAHEFKDMMSPTRQQELKEAAIDAVHNDKRAKAMKLELDIMFKNSPEATKKLIKQLMKKLPANEQIKAKAQQELKGTNLVEVKPHIYANRARVAVRESGEAFAKGDFELAIKKKLEEVLNHYLYREARKIQETVEKRIEKSKKRLSKSDEKLANIGQVDTMKIAQSVMAKFGMLTDTQIKRLDAYKETLKSVDPAAYNKVLGLTDYLVEANAQPYTQLTFEEFTEVMDTVEALYDLAKSEKYVTIGGQKIDRAVVVNNLTAVLDELKDRNVRDPKERDISGWQKWKAEKAGIVDSWKTNMTRMEHFVNWIDKGDFDGPFRTYLWNLASDGQDRYELRKEATMSQLQNIIDTRFKKLIENKDPIYIDKYFPGTHKDWKHLTRQNLIMALLHSGNKSNQKKLLLGRNWGTERIDGTVDTTQWDKFISDMIDQGIITKDVMDGVQAIWDLFETLKGDMQKVHKEVYGYFFKEIEFNPLATPWGEYKGGYAPAVTDPDIVAAQGLREDKASTERDMMQFMMLGTPKGMTKERVDGYNKALSLNFMNILSHLEKVVRFIELEKVVTDINKIISSEKFINTVNDKNPDWNSGLFKKWNSRMASQRTYAPGDTKGTRAFMKAMGELRRNANMQIMFMNFKNTIEQVVDMPSLLVHMNSKELLGAIGGRITQGNMLEAAGQYTSEPQNLMDNITDLSSFMANRLQSQIYEINDKISELVLPDGKVTGNINKVKKFARKNAYVLQRMLQNQIEIIAWTAAYNSALEAYGGDNAKAAKKADSVIRLTFGSNRIMDIANIEAQNELMAAFLPFYSYFLNKGNVLMYAPEGKFKSHYFYALYIPAVLTAMLSKAFGGFEIEDEEKDFGPALVEDVVDIFLLAQLKVIFASVPFGSNAMGLGEAAARKVIGLDVPQYQSRVSLSPILGMTENFIAPINLMTREEIKGQDIKDTMTFLGFVTGVPLAPLGKYGKLAIDVQQGKQYAENPLDLTRGALTGRTGKKGR
jgi:hypothetical protein